MKYILTIALLLFCVSAQAGWVADHSSLSYNLTFVPPHNEPVIGDKVARYRVQMKPRIEFEYLRYELQIDAWGVNTWLPTSQIGNGSDAWENSDYSVEKWRIGLTHRAEIGPETVHLFSEYYIPVDRKSWGGHGLERHYYWLVGIGGKLW